MNIFFRKLLRDIKTSMGQFISLFIIVVIGVTFYTGINSTFRNLIEAKDKYYEGYRFGHLWFDIYKAPYRITKEIEKLPMVKMATGRIVKDVSLKINGENATVRLITLPDKKNDIVNDIQILSKNYFSEGEINQCIVDERFLKANGLKIGNYICPIINGNEVKIKIIGSALGPEFIYPLKDSGELISDNKKFGIVYIKNSLGQAIFGYNNSINNITVLLNDNKDIKAAKEEIEKVLKSYGIADVIERDDQLSNRMINIEIEKLKKAGSAYPVIFFIVASVIIYIMMGRMIENQRVQIGVLKAMGFSDFKIFSHYLSYSILIALLGSFVGSIFGMYLGGVFTKILNIYFSLPLGAMKIYPDLALPASLLTLFFCILSSYNSCKTIFKIMPGETIRPTIPKSGKKIFLERYNSIWNNISHISRLVFRNVLRYKKRAMITSIGIIFSTVLLIIAFGMNDSVDFLIEQQYKNIQNYDIKVNFNKLMSIEELNSIINIKHIEKMEPLLETGVEISNGWIKKKIGFTALIKNPQYYKVTDDKGRSIELPSKGIMIPTRLAEILGVKQNDTVYIKPFFPGKEKKEVVVKGTIAQYIGLSAYASVDYVNNIFNEGKIANAAVLKIDDKAFAEEVKNNLRDLPSISSVQSKDDSYNALMGSMSAMTSTIGVLIVLAAILSIAVLYNIATINIFERQKELATLKVMGFKDNEIKKLIFNENYIITIFGIIIALPFGTWLGKLIMIANSTDNYYFQFVIKFKSYIFAIVFTFFFTFIANWILIKKIKSINIVETLKSGE
ncbi:FtsX-like permease family protein [Caloramator sp. E03]|uniref:ABC transporter permease n=1 Tax=Caloramator sp. E03 TaxID=2576307 RepID=UPI001110B0D0|nr:FtsX-like permease family protein [Caloramator sp. E03]QCX32843.1 FtsX-like permease family protein [Caloramator sp. E03]